MRRMILALLALLLSVTSATAAGPATAHDGVCVGGGTMHTSAPLTYVTLGSSVTTFWSISFSIGGCATAAPDIVTLSASGVLTGWCNLSTGTGVTTQGHRFSWVGIGGAHYYTGELVGEVPFVANVISGDSCELGANDFLVGYAGALMWNCKVTDTSGTLTTVPGLPVHYHLCA